MEEQDPVHVTGDMCNRRLTFLRRLFNWATFGKGWGRRVEDVRIRAMDMAAGKGSAIVGIAPSVEYKIVKNGFRGIWVEKLQEALKIQVDGKFGNDTPGHTQSVARKTWVGA